MKALLTAEPNQAIVTDVPIPEPQVGEIRIRVQAVALNPVDALFVAHPLDKNFGRVVGSDIAGTVEKLGPGVENWEIGDRVAGFLQGGRFHLTHFLYYIIDYTLTACSLNPRPGGFAEYAVLEADLAFRIPSGVSFEEAATVPLCSLTAVQALLMRLGLPIPFATSTSFPKNYPSQPTRVPTILVYSASTSLGLFVLSLLQSILAADPVIKLNVIAIGSQKNHAKFASLGAHHSFDYRDTEWQRKVLEATNGQGIDYAVDCLSEGESTAEISQVFGTGVNPDGIRKAIAVVRKAWNPENLRKDVELEYGAVWTGLGHDITYDNGYVLDSPASHRQLAVDFFKFLSAGAPNDPTKLPIEPNPVRLMPGGLAEIVKDGFELLGSDLVNKRTKLERSEEYMRPISAEKLVYRI